MELIVVGFVLEFLNSLLDLRVVAPGDMVFESARHQEVWVSHYVISDHNMSVLNEGLCFFERLHIF